MKKTEKTKHDAKDTRPLCDEKKAGPKRGGMGGQPPCDGRQRK